MTTLLAPPAEVERTPATDADCAFAQPWILVVDDSPIERRVAGNVVTKKTDLAVRFANDGLEALAILKDHRPLMVLTDVHMPNMDGMELVGEMRAVHPEIPVILMTAQGNEDTAIKALRLGAANYIPKRDLAVELPPIVLQLLTIARLERRRNDLLSCLTQLDCSFDLDNDPAKIPLLVAHLQEYAERTGVCDKNGKIRLGVSLEEALLNGIYHGNLEVSSKLKEEGDHAFDKLAAERRQLTPYCQRRLHVRAKLDRDVLAVVIRDEGPGFDVGSLPDPTDPENLLKPHGRGLMLIRTFMDEANHNAAGNELTLVKRRRTAAA